MNTTFFLDLLAQPTFIIFISTFAGAFVGEFYREANNKKQCNFTIFFSKFLISWFTATATILLIHSFFELNNEMLIALSIIFGIIGHKDSIKFAKNLIESKFK